MYRKIEIVGMRKDRDKKIVFAIIIFSIIGIIASLGFIFYNKHKIVEASAQNTNVITEEVSMSDNSANIEGKSDNAEDKEVSNSQPSDDANGNKQISEDVQKFIDSVKNIYNGTDGKRVFLTMDQQKKLHHTY